MNKLIITLISVIVSLFPVTVYASGLVPRECSIRENGHIYSLEYETYYFDANIGVNENPVATVYCESQPVGTGILSVTNYHTPGGLEGRANIVFDPVLNLPKGNTVLWYRQA